MSAPSILKKYYDTSLSATQDIDRCISFNSGIFPTFTKLHVQLDVTSQPSAGDAILIDNNAFRFVTTTPETDYEIEIGANTTETAENIVSCLGGHNLFPTYSYDVSNSGDLVTILGNKQGLITNRVIQVATAPTITKTTVSQASDYGYPDDFRLVLDIRVDGKRFSELYVSMETFYNIDINSYQSRVLANVNAVLKDAVYTATPNLTSYSYNRLDNACKYVQYHYYTTYTGHNGLEQGEDVYEDDGYILNARGERLTSFQVQSDSDYNSLKDYHSSGGYPYKMMIERPREDRQFEICKGSPFLVGHWMDSTIAGGLIMYDVNGTKTYQTISSQGVYTSDGVYVNDLGTLANLLGLGHGDELGMQLLYQEEPNVYGAYSEYVSVKFKKASECCHYTSFVYLNKFGIYETIELTGHFKEDMDILQDVGSQCVDCSDKYLSRYSKAPNKVVNTSHTIKNTIYITIPNTPQDIDWLKSFLYSAKVYRIDEGNELTPVKVNTKTRTIKKTTSSLRIRIQYEVYSGVRSQTNG